MFPAGVWLPGDPAVLRKKIESQNPWSPVVGGGVPDRVLAFHPCPLKGERKIHLRRYGKAGLCRHGQPRRRRRYIGRASQREAEFRGIPPESFWTILRSLSSESRSTERTLPGRSFVLERRSTVAFPSAIAASGTGTERPGLRGVLLGETGLLAGVLIFLFIGGEPTRRSVDPIGRCWWRQA